MRNIFIGFLLIFLDFNLNIGNSTIGFIPDFVGYFFLIKGIDELISQSTLFAKVRSLSIGMGIYTSILYAMDLLGLKMHLGWLGIVLGIVSSVISLYISYIVVSGVQEMETSHGIELNGEKLRSTWNYMAIFQIAAFISVIIPVLAIIFYIISFIAAITFLIQFNTSKNLYETTT
ncbi:MAG: hypothetical protein K0S60_78 [Evtepia sp.]|jgi:hypothetical protein|nr:hypothetical protein [Evtepia sp.]